MGCNPIFLTGSVLSPAGADNQSLKLSSTALMIERGDSVTLEALAAALVANPAALAALMAGGIGGGTADTDKQSLGLTATEFTIERGTSVTLAALGAALAANPAALTSLANALTSNANFVNSLASNPTFATTLATNPALRGVELQDAFGVPMGYLLPV